MSTVKENNLFLDDDASVSEYHALEPTTYGASDRTRRRGLTDREILQRWLCDYRGERILGDSAPYYTKAPIVGDGVPAKIRQLSPDARLIYIIRNPLARLVSAHAHDARIWISRGMQPGTLEEHVRSRPHLLWTTRYHYQIARYLRTFDAGQIEVLLLEDLEETPHDVMRRLCEFLGVDPTFRFDVTLKHHTRPDEQDSRPYSRELFEYVLAELTPDMEDLEAALGRNVRARWDLAPETWIPNLTDDEPPTHS